MKALKQAAELVEAGDGAAAEAAQQPEKPVLKFRNYAVRDEKIEHEKVIPSAQGCRSKRQTSHNLLPSSSPVFVCCGSLS